MSARSSTAGPSGSSESVATLRSLACVRSRCKLVYEAAKSDKLTHFRLDLSKLDDVATFVQGKIRSPTYLSLISARLVLPAGCLHQHASVRLVVTSCVVQTAVERLT